VNVCGHQPFPSGAIIDTSNKNSNLPCKNQSKQQQQRQQTLFAQTKTINFPFNPIIKRKVLLCCANGETKTKFSDQVLSGEVIFFCALHQQNVGFSSG
jgi:hypothetical protein